MKKGKKKKQKKENRREDEKKKEIQKYAVQEPLEGFPNMGKAAGKLRFPNREHYFSKNNSLTFY